MQEILKPNYLLSQRIIEQAAKNQIKIDTKINVWLLTICGI